MGIGASSKEQSGGCDYGTNDDGTCKQPPAPQQLGGRRRRRRKSRKRKSRNKRKKSRSKRRKRKRSRRRR